MDISTMLFVYQRIRRLEANDVELAEDYISRMDPLLYQSALLNFGSWREALLTAGIDYENELKASMYPRIVK